MPGGGRRHRCRGRLAHRDLRRPAPAASSGRAGGPLLCRPGPTRHRGPVRQWRLGADDRAEPRRTPIGGRDPRATGRQPNLLAGLRGKLCSPTPEVGSRRRRSWRRTSPRTARWCGKRDFAPIRAELRSHEGRDGRRPRRRRFRLRSLRSRSRMRGQSWTVMGSPRPSPRPSDRPPSGGPAPLLRGETSSAPGGGGCRRPPSP